MVKITKKEPEIPKKLSREEKLKKWNTKRLEIQKELHAMIKAGSGKSDAFWVKKEEMDKYQIKIYNLSKQRIL